MRVRDRLEMLAEKGRVSGTVRRNPKPKDRRLTRSKRDLAPNESRQVAEGFDGGGDALVLGRLAELDKRNESNRRTFQQR